MPTDATIQGKSLTAMPFVLQLMTASTANAAANAIIATNPGPIETYTTASLAQNGGCGRRQSTYKATVTTTDNSNRMIANNVDTYFDLDGTYGRSTDPAN